MLLPKEPLFRPKTCLTTESRRENLQRRKKTGSDRPYHYLGSVIRHNRIAKAFGQAMPERLPKEQSPSGSRVRRRYMGGLGM